VARVTGRHEPDAAAEVDAWVVAQGVQKAGNEPEEYEDAWHVTRQRPRPRDRRPVPATVRIAVADGATRSALAGPWARGLTAELCGCPLRALRDPAGFRDTVTALSDAWPAGLRAHVRGLGRPLHYWEPSVLGVGAAATVLAAAVLPPRPGGPGWSWRAAAVGDCCLFHVRGDTLLGAFPVTSSADFGTTPPLVHSLDALGPGGTGEVRRASAEAAPGDLLLLATDALAAWALGGHESGDAPWRRLAEAATEPDRFAALVARLRGDGGLKNDDTTLVAVRLPPALPAGVASSAVPSAGRTDPDGAAR
jgi:hypothetical protein